MSLFDVIRYPISNPPTEDELRALPRELFLNWIRISDWVHYTELPDIINPKHISEWYAGEMEIGGMTLLSTKDKNDLINLRRMIADYEPV